MSTNNNSVKRTNRKFSKEEDNRLKELVREYGENSWDDIALQMKDRNIRQCHDRWFFYLSPKINNAPWTEEEDKKLIKYAEQLNGKWVQIAKHFKGRNDTQIKNRWNSLKKRITLPEFTRKRTKKPAKGIENTNNFDLSNKKHIELTIDHYISILNSIENDEMDLANLF